MATLMHTHALCCCCERSKPVNNTAIQYEKPAPLHLIGGSIGSNVVVGNGTIIYDVGVRWQNGGHIVQGAGTTGAFNECIFYLLCNPTSMVLLPLNKSMLKR